MLVLERCYCGKPGLSDLLKISEAISKMCNVECRVSTDEFSNLKIKAIFEIMKCPENLGFLIN